MQGETRDEDLVLYSEPRHICLSFVLIHNYNVWYLFSHSWNTGYTFSNMRPSQSLLTACSHTHRYAKTCIFVR